jgi:RIO kinase 1
MSLHNHKLSPASFIEQEAGEDLANPGGRRRLRHRRKKLNEHMRLDQLQQHVGGAEAAATQLGVEAVFNPTFVSSKHEREWIFGYLGAFYDDKQITDVLARVKGGKEANVYCCAAHPATGLDLIAAKIYRPRMFRQLRNDARYRQGRSYLDERGKEVRDGKLLTAIAKKTSTGQEVIHNSWLEHEFQTLKRLYAAGADVPRPVSRGNNTILMEYRGDAELPAPALQSIRLEPDEVQPLFERLMRNIELMLAQQRIHGDLSAFNVLYWDGDIRLIDFPQAVSPADNPEAFELLERDIRRVCQYFERYGLRADAAHIARDLWERYGAQREEPLDLLNELADAGQDPP